jgi:hypothetical protein
MTKATANGRQAVEVPSASSVKADPSLKISIGLDVMCGFNFRGIHRTMDLAPSVPTKLRFQWFGCWCVEGCKSIWHLPGLDCF